MSKLHLSETKEKEAEVSFEVKEEIGVVARRSKQEIRLDYGSWNGKPAKYEIRIWREKNGEMAPTKGIGLTGEELQELYNIIGKLL